MAGIRSASGRSHAALISACQAGICAAVKQTSYGRRERFLDATT